MKMRTSIALLKNGPANGSFSQGFDPTHGASVTMTKNRFGYGEPMNAFYAIDYEHDQQWEKEITADPVIQLDGEPDYSFIDRLFERLEEENGR
jgi:hypothetical protein